MVYFYQSQPDELSIPHWIVVGKDKEENDLLIKYGYKDLGYYWFHADRYSSAHVYLKLLDSEKDLADVPRLVINDCLQLCKSKSIQGNKLAQCAIIVTPWHNLRKSGYMKPGEVSFKSTKRVQRMECHARENKILNRLDKTRIEVIDNVEQLLHEAKKSKDGEFLSNFVKMNRDRLREDEQERRRTNKLKKKSPQNKDSQPEEKATESPS
ncbi:LAFE_0C10660g1_1 [Lachancea fermentati]|uniref:LAFE_0C10660g1_1 n=1 Tax=Lachancea fermentati TaxID=4955 RepID=A0A1G4MA30_LACFM|nr:LAFE_0C10660g1_1 [Lachancea fermentati]